MEIVLPLANTHRIVCDGSYFVSVTVDEFFCLNGLKFIGFVKTATRKYPNAHLYSQELEKRGDRYGLVKRKTRPYRCDLLAYIWMDQDGRYFISLVSSMDNGDNMERTRSLHIEDASTNADPIDVTLTIPQPKASEIYYGACSKINQHNRFLQESLNIEKKLQTHEWDKGANLGVFVNVGCIFLDVLQ